MSGDEMVFVGEGSGAPTGISGTEVYATMGADAEPSVFGMIEEGAPGLSVAEVSGLVTGISGMGAGMVEVRATLWRMVSDVEPSVWKDLSGESSLLSSSSLWLSSSLSKSTTVVALYVT